MLRTSIGLNISPSSLVPLRYIHMRLLEVSCDSLGLWVWHSTWLMVSLISGCALLDRYCSIPNTSAYIHLPVFLWGSPPIYGPSRVCMDEVSVRVQFFVPVSSRRLAICQTIVNLIVLSSPVPVLAIYIPRKTVIFQSSYFSSNFWSYIFSTRTSKHLSYLADNIQSSTYFT